MSTQEAFIFTNTCFSNVGEFVAHICSSLEISFDFVDVIMSVKLFIHLELHDFTLSVMIYVYLPEQKHAILGLVQGRLCIY